MLPQQETQPKQNGCSNIAVFCVAGCMLSATMIVGRDSWWKTSPDVAPIATAPVSFAQLGENTEGGDSEGTTTEVVEQEAGTEGEEGGEQIVIEEVPQDTTEVVEVLEPATTDAASEEAAPASDGAMRNEVEQQTIYVDENGHQLSASEADAITNEAPAAEAAPAVQKMQAVTDAQVQAQAQEQAPVQVQLNNQVQQQQQQQQVADQQQQQQAPMNMPVQNNDQVQNAQGMVQGQQQGNANQANAQAQTPEEAQQQREITEAESRLRVPSKAESQPLDTSQLMNQVKEPVLDNDYKSILLDITKMVAQARFIMSRAFVGGQLGASSFLQQASKTEESAQHSIAPDADVIPKTHFKVPASPRRFLKRDASVLSRDDPN